MEYSVLYITYTQGGTVRLEKSLTEVSVQEGVITVQLTQEETLAFRPGSGVAIQIRLRTAAGLALASDVISVRVEDVLKDGVI